MPRLPARPVALRDDGLGEYWLLPEQFGSDWHGRMSHLAPRIARCDHVGVEPADKEDARAIMHAEDKLDDILYILGEGDDEEEEEDETDS